MNASPVPLAIRVRFMHATLQFLADQAGIRILHIKGPALHPDLLQHDATGAAVPRSSTDADVIIEPGRAAEFLALATRTRFRQVTEFETGSPFEHAATVWADDLGYADLHRFFPGVNASAAAAFEELWRGRESIELAGRACQVPSLEAQRLILLLHHARSGGGARRDKVVAWDEASDEQRAGVRDLARRLDAELALAAAIGELDRFRDTAGFELWDQFSRHPDHTRTAEWRARIRAARTPWAKVRLVGRSLLVNTDHLAMSLGHQPTRKEIVQAWFRRIRRGAQEWRRR